MTCYFRKVITIRAADSPNVKAGREIIPGVIGREELAKRRATWDVVRQTIGLDAEFYEGAQILLYPPDWLSAAHDAADRLDRCRPARSIGIDPAEGGDQTSMAAVDERGLIELVSKKTPDTSQIPAEALAFMRKHQCEPHKVYFDRGGGGKQHADRLRQQGYKVQTVAFGETPSLDLRTAQYPVNPRRAMQEEKYAYVNRRAEMYGLLRQRLDPSLNPTGVFGLPRQYTELRRQLAPMPLLWDAEGRMRMLPKDKKDPDSKQPTLRELLGCSPDEADSLVLAVFGLTHKGTAVEVGAIATLSDLR